jgi:hypothetical protein
MPACVQSWYRTQQETSVSRRDFELIAQNISHISDAAARRLAAIAVAGACQQLNPRFNADLFFRACGVSEH